MSFDDVSVLLLSVIEKRGMKANGVIIWHIQRGLNDEYEIFTTVHTETGIYTIYIEEDEFKTATGKSFSDIFKK